MSELLTTRQLEELLNVDRTTIYRMASRGKLPAIRVGNQWRFPREAVEAWLEAQTRASSQKIVLRPHPDSSAETEFSRLLPLDCVQNILDTFADVLGVMLLLTDLDGHLVLPPSNPCGLYVAANAYPRAHHRCVQQWVHMARNPSLHPQFIVSQLGFLCARGLVRVESELKGMLIAGGIAPENWPPGPDELARIADELDIPVEVYQEHVHEVYYLSEAEKDRVLAFIQRIADIISHIADERRALVNRLDQIRQLVELP